jgi:hypothetical protein
MIKADFSDEFSQKFELSFASKFFKPFRPLQTIGIPPQMKISLAFARTKKYSRPVSTNEHEPASGLDPTTAERTFPY